MTITTVGIDLAKNVFAVHCVDQHSKTVSPDCLLWVYPNWSLKVIARENVIVT